ncbi:hypothetical protein PsYK624_064930 [Phanerochaete sordida]|uniref:Fungal-type protein kinase domain-containing protein n=1 Tax=Phanerochaete sordida TaxID=48140 RepID=A0A9P3G960_9APHY|nr:hypothetical protein PsYK624_064930 [Phanerochaete sordida]
MEHMISFVKWEVFMQKYVGSQNLSPATLAKVGTFSTTLFPAEEEQRYLSIIVVVKALFDLMELPYIPLATADWPESDVDGVDNVDDVDDVQDVDIMKPAICVYDTTPSGGRAAWQLSQDDLSPMPGHPQWKSDLRARAARMAWAWVVTIIDVKNSNIDAPFLQKAGKWLPAGHRRAVDSRAQMASCAAEIQLRQHRKFLFTVCIWRHLAWFLRWDRAGVIITEPIDYIKDPAPLLNFLYRVHSSSKSDQGFDTSASLALPAHVDLFRNHVESLPKSTKKNYALDALSDPENFPIYAIKCPDVEWMNLLDAHMQPSGRCRPQETKIYLVGKFRFGTRSPTGRGGKGYIAYDVDRGRLVFLKDYWCARAKGIHPELAIYKVLKEKNVRFVATAIAGGDVEDQVTASHNHYTGSGRRPAERFHHRVVVWQVGRPLETYIQGGKRLVLYVAQAVIGHKEAWRDAQILHRDVSMSNILIDLDEGAAFLNDWDLCKFKWELLDGASQHDRAGTRPYMSGTLLSYPKKPNELADDIESFVYVISIALLRFHVHSLSGDRVYLAQHVTFKYETETHDGAIAGGTKIRDMLRGDPGFDLIEKEDGPKHLSTLLTRLYQLGQNHYRNLDLEDLQRKYGVSPLQEFPRPIPVPGADGTMEELDLSFADLGFDDDDDEDTASAPDGHAAKDTSAISAGPSAGLSSSDDLFAPVSRQSESNVAPATSRVTSDFNSHGPLIAILLGRGDETWDDGWDDDKVGDQFSGLERWVYVESKGDTSSNRTVEEY